MPEAGKRENHKEDLKRIQMYLQKMQSQLVSQAYQRTGRKRKQWHCGTSMCNMSQLQKLFLEYKKNKETK